MPRVFPDWLSGFVTHTASIESPEIFRLWTGLSTISGALQRQTFARVKGRPLYPNQYIALVAEPGVGKSNAIAEGVNLMRKAGLNLAPDAFTKERLFELMQKSFQKSELIGQKMSMIAACTAAPDEWGVLIKQNDEDFMNALVKLWDCPELFEYETKGAGQNRIEGVYLNMIAGCTPRWIAQTLPISAFEGGFVARVVFVYSQDKVMLPLSHEIPDADLETGLIADLQQIAKLRGEFKWEPAAFTALSDWYNKGMPPMVSEARFATYNTRRLSHCVKICQVVSASRSDDLIISLADFKRTKEIMLLTEQSMGSATKSSGKNDLITITEQAVQWVGKQNIQTQRPVPEWALRRFMWKDVPAPQLNFAIDTMVSTGQVTCQTVGTMRFFTVAVDTSTNATVDT